MASTILPVLTPEMKDEIKDLISGVLNHNLQVLGEVNVGVFSAASVALLSKPITNDVLIFSDDDVPNGSFPGLAGDLYIQRIDNGTSAKRISSAVTSSIYISPKGLMIWFFIAKVYPLMVAEETFADFISNHFSQYSATVGCCLRKRISSICRRASDCFSYSSSQVVAYKFTRLPSAS